MKVIDYFDDFEGPNEYAFLSNFYLHPVQYRDEMWPTTEHAYQAMKSRDWRERLIIMRAETPGRAKRLGQKVTLDPLWETRKFIVMNDLLRIKFSPEGPLAVKLMNTGDAKLIEGNTWHDMVWGDCRCGKHIAHGANWLGRLLMVVRADLQDRVA